MVDAGIADMGDADLAVMGDEIVRPLRFSRRGGRAHGKLSEFPPTGDVAFVCSQFWKTQT